VGADEVDVNGLLTGVDLAVVSDLRAEAAAANPWEAANPINSGRMAGAMAERATPKTASNPITQPDVRDFGNPVNF
jgi:hypothetical protein